jgi:hypothetical protein
MPYDKVLAIIDPNIAETHYLVPNANPRDNILAGLTELSKLLRGLPRTTGR